ncbi:MAG: PTS sugar transporter subunit IIA [Planctomycetes bacterium]|nr:PTS sugar transporter subunit IIA [Planctomycetota bacterium]
MKLTEMLKPAHVLVPLEAADKWQAIRVMAQALVAAGAMPERLYETVETALFTRERSMSTGMEQGIAIPHAAVEGVPEVVAALAISQRGIPFEALDQRPARILVCLVVPREKKLLHIKTLASIAKLLSRGEVRERILACQSAVEVLDVVAREEGA